MGAEVERMSLLTRATVVSCECALRVGVVSTTRETWASLTPRSRAENDRHVREALVARPPLAREPHGEDLHDAARQTTPARAGRTMGSPAGPRIVRTTPLAGSTLRDLRL
jgi:hypothetical protein